MIHCRIWVSLYFWFEVIIYRTPGLVTNHEIARLVGQMCLHIWLPLNKLESNADTQFSDPLQHMGELVFPVEGISSRTSGFATNYEIDCIAGQTCSHIWLPLGELKLDARTDISGLSKHTGRLISPV